MSAAMVATVAKWGLNFGAVRAFMGAALLIGACLERLGGWASGEI